MERETNGAEIGDGQTQMTSTQSSYMLTFLAYMSHAFFLDELVT
jgi:hypothetical protein